MDCSNYRGISLLSIAGKILSSIIRARMNDVYEANLKEEQAGFRQGRGCADQVFNLRQVFERQLRNGRDFGALFIDFAAAFDSLHRDSLWAALLSAGMPAKLVRILKAMYADGRNQVKVYGDLTRPFAVRTGVRQGCIPSPALFNVALDWILRKAVLGVRGVMISDDLRLTHLGYADDLVYIGESEADIQQFTNNLNKCALKLGLKISAKKTKLISTVPMAVTLDGVPIESVDKFVYLGSTFSKGSVTASEEIQVRIGKAAAVFGRLRKPVFSRRDIATKTKMKIYNSSVASVLLYCAESWAYSAEDLRKCEVFQAGCLRSILGISLRDHVRNDIVRSRCCDQPTVEAMIRKARLRWLGHVNRMPLERHPVKLLWSVRPTGWLCPRTAPRLSWKRLVNDDLKRAGLQLQNRVDPMRIAREMAQDRDQWRGFVRDSYQLPATASRRRDEL